MDMLLTDQGYDTESTIFLINATTQDVVFMPQHNQTKLRISSNTSCPEYVVLLLVGINNSFENIGTKFIP